MCSLKYMAASKQAYTHIITNPGNIELNIVKTNSQVSQTMKQNNKTLQHKFPELQYAADFQIYAILQV